MCWLCSTGILGDVFWNKHNRWGPLSCPTTANRQPHWGAAVTRMLPHTELAKRLCFSMRLGSSCWAGGGVRWALPVRAWVEQVNPSPQGPARICLGSQTERSQPLHLSHRQGTSRVAPFIHPLSFTSSITVTPSQSLHPTSPGLPVLF